MKVGDLVKSTRYNNSLGIIVKEDDKCSSGGMQPSMYYVYWQRSSKIELAWVGGLTVINESR